MYWIPISEIQPEDDMGQIYILISSQGGRRILEKITALTHHWFSICTVAQIIQH